MKKHENLEKIKALYNRCGDVVFRMTLQHLFDSGKQHFTAENVAESKNSIRANPPKNPIMTADFQCDLLDCSLELSAFPFWDILLYVKLYLPIKDDNLMRLHEAEQALKFFDDSDITPSWRDALSDPDLQEEVVREMANNHHDRYSDEEIREAILQIAEI